MTPNEARAILYQQFIDNWAPPDPVVPYVFENEHLDTDGLPEWVKVVVANLSREQHTLGSVGNRVFRGRGAVIAEVHVAADTGLLRLDQLCKAALDLFEAKTIQQVMLHNGTYRELPRAGRWMKGQVSVLFTYDETK